MPRILLSLKLMLYSQYLHLGLNGLAPLSGGGSTNFLRADGTWASPSGSFTNPMTTLGDIIYENATPAPARLAGNTTSTKMMLSQTGTGSVSAAPVWAALVSGDIPNNAANTSGTAANITASSNSTLTTLSSLSLPTSQLSGNISLTTQVSGTLPVANGGSGQSSALTAGGAIYSTSTTAMASTAAGTSGNVLISGGVGAPSFSATPTLAGVINTSNVFKIEDSADNTKVIAINASGNTTAITLTLASAQSTSQTLSIPNIAGADTIGTLATTQTFSGAKTFSATLTASAAVTLSGTTTNFTASSQTSGLITLGGAAATGTITVGQSTGNQTVNIATGATASGSTKALNLGDRWSIGIYYKYCNRFYSRYFNYYDEWYSYPCKCSGSYKWWYWIFCGPNSIWG